MSPRKRRKTEHTEEWANLVPLFWWPEQEEYEEIRPLVLFGDSVAERAVQTGSSERTLYRRISGFENEGMLSLFGAEPAKRQVLPISIRRMVLDLKAKYPPFNANEISRICYARSGRKPDRHTVQRVLSEEALQLKANRRFHHYHETPESRERRANVVKLHYEGWTDKAIAGYLKVNRSTVYRVIRRWVEEGPVGLEDKPRGRPKGVQKVDLRAILAVKEIQENPKIGAFRVQAALEQAGIHLGVRTVGRILKMNRETYGFGKPARSPHQKKQMPFEATRRHQIWTADVRYIKKHRLPLDGYPYVISILDNYSRCVLASSVSTSQDTDSFLAVLYRAIERYGAPEMLVTDGGRIFRADRALTIYEFLGIDKEEIERHQPWQSYIETTLTVPMECPSMSSSLQRTVSGVQRAARAHRRRESGRSSSVAQRLACRCV